MYTLRLMAAAALFNGNDLLMMKRSPLRTLSPGQWAAIGGHLEPEEIGDPRRACLREIEEETGLTSDDLVGLQLRYILLRLNGNELRQQFIYVGETKRRNVATTDEGELHWIPQEEVFARSIPFIYRELLAHWFQNGPAEHIWMATAGRFGVDGSAGDPNPPSLLFTPVLDPGTI